jgi:hypothetical protein
MNAKKVLTMLAAGAIPLVGCQTTAPEDPSSRESQALSCLASPAPQWWRADDGVTDPNAIWILVDGVITSTTGSDGQVTSWVPYVAVNRQTQTILAIEWVSLDTVPCFAETHAVCFHRSTDGNGASGDDGGSSPRKQLTKPPSAPPVCLPPDFWTTVHAADTCSDVTDLAHAPACRTAGFKAATTWNSAACPSGSICKIADVNNDGRADLVELTHNASPQAYVALSTGAAFGPRTQWSGFFCQANETCDVADVDGNGSADLVAIDVNHNAWVGLSNGQSFGAPQVWAQGVCFVENGEVCKLADMTGDKRADLVAFTHGAGGLAPRVFVLPSSGSGFGAAAQWSSFFCQASEECAVGDVDGNHLADVIAFTRDAGGDAVWVGRNLGGGIDQPQRSNTGAFCRNGETCAVSDVNGDGLADVVAFTHGANPGAANPYQAWVGLAIWAQRAGQSFRAPVLWDNFFCQSFETCLTGDVNGDSTADIIATTNSSTPGPVWVAPGPMAP